MNCFSSSSCCCFRCQRFNHTAAKCRSTEVRCVRCGGGHEYKDCDRKDHPKCANCGGPHSTAAPICPTFLREKAAKKIERLEGKPYYLAARAVKKQQPVTYLSDVQQPARIKPGPARPAWTTTDSGDAPEQPAQQIPRQRRQVITVQPPVVDMDTQTTTTHATDDGDLMDQKIEEVASCLRLKIDNIADTIQKRMDDIAEKLQHKVEKIVVETRQRLDGLKAQQDALSAEVERQKQQQGELEKQYTGHRDAVVKEVIKLQDEKTYMMEKLQDANEIILFLLKTARLSTQMNRRQTRPGTEDNEQHRVLLEDIDTRSNKLADRIARFAETLEKNNRTGR